MGECINFRTCTKLIISFSVRRILLLRVLILCLVTGLFFTSGLRAQSGNALDLESLRSGGILNTITISLEQPAVDSIHASIKDKYSFHPREINVNGVQIAEGEIKLHGSSSMIFRRKSYNIKLRDNVPLYDGKDTVYLHHFYAISLSMDRNYIRNAIAMEVLSQTGLTIPRHFYARLDLNDSTEGIYMICDPPQEYALREYDSRMVIRRGYNSDIDDFYTRHISPYSEKLIRERYLYIYNYLLQDLSGKELYKKLDNILEMKSYFEWLAFNYLFQNGDYTDEVYFYWEHDRKKFNIIPWDFDDLLHNEPHEGEKIKEARIGDKLIFSSEDNLDRAIANTPVIYTEYLKEFNRFLQQFTPDDLKEVLEDVYRDVYPYFREEDLLAQSGFDKSGITSIEKLNVDIETIYRTVSRRMTELRNGPLSIVCK
jgi:spore coat protein H